MSLVRWRNKRSNEGTPLAPPSNVRGLRTEIDRLFDHFFEDFGGLWPESAGSPGEWLPAFDVTENEKEVAVRAEVPGVDPKDIEVSVTGNVLTISGEKKESSEQNDETMYRCERRFGRFQRSIELPTAVEVDKVTANNSNGVLTVRLPRTEAAKAKRITVAVDSK